VIALTMGIIAPVGPARAATLTHWVDNDASASSAPGSSCADAGYATIQDAVSSADASDVISVCPGSYTENVVVGTTDLTIESTGGASVTTVAAAESFYVFQVLSPGVTLEGFTIVPAGIADGDIGVNVAIEGDTHETLLRNVVIGGRIGVNLGCASFGSAIVHNTVSGQTEAGINVDTCEAPPFPGSHDNAIHHNVACSVTSTASIALGGSSNDNAIHHNVATSISVFGTGNKVHHNRTSIAITDSGFGNDLHHNASDPGVCS
jgi:hypothetical protein